MIFKSPEFTRFFDNLYPELNGEEGVYGELLSDTHSRWMNAMVLYFEKKLNDKTKS